MDQNVTHNGSGANLDNNQNDNNMASLLEKEGLGIDFPTQGEIRKGIIASITPGQILVSVGTKSEGIITGKEYELIPSDELANLKVGDEISVYVVNPEDQNGNLVLSYMRAREEESWQEVEALQASKQATHSTILGYNKGGLIVPIGGLRGFVPASQISLTRRAGVTGDTPEQRWGKMIGQEIDVCVIEVDRERRRLILSERQASTETRESVKERVLEELKEGEVYLGRITSLADFGVFVNVNGADGLVHMSEISWERIQHPSEILKVGQEVKVKVINIDHEKKRIGLSIRQLQSDPWDQKAAQFQVGQLIEGTITRLTKFGAFARLAEDIEGLIHISEISERRIEHPKEVLKEGDICTLRIIKIDPSVHRIGLSLRRVDSMAYADMDWQALEGILDEDTAVIAKDDDQSTAEEPTEPAPEA
ncbi:MAG TPA: S1 RNA-binding domain-containing protein [Anaerolineaceae bacterium]|jgi:small subunit ribosomal protein S1|nr:S1 RNA-binding domain-containing protein [Chloroflexota bacterium]HNS07359.1 S1 RNA-binding domain-containing protein [Anaerolineaceae bacterium]HNW13067.1 S1 RNA-binding domain-containing protein [Anaerolineaceae bacterium]HOE01755.1 S1 RNA-binding domain-containing protein [Anaerolineaceae bacterium]HOS53212.1 S1 RNA-binding domain-containing protein [Anaerolineaceae bacterium]